MQYPGSYAAGGSVSLIIGWIAGQNPPRKTEIILQGLPDQPDGLDLHFVGPVSEQGPQLNGRIAVLPAPCRNRMRQTSGSADVRPYRNRTLALATQ